MTDVSIPFTEQFRDKMLSGRKTCTTRTKRYGKIGDTFQAFGATFVLEKVERLPLGEVLHFFYWQEGFGQPSEFKECWHKLHPRRGYDPQWRVVLHDFRLIDGTKGE